MRSRLSLLGAFAAPIVILVVLVWLGQSGKYESLTKYFLFAGVALLVNLGPTYLYFHPDECDEAVERFFPELSKLANFSPGGALRNLLTFLLVLASLAIYFNMRRSGVILR